jgi:GNAT superfamily N-acetyltransferase
VTSITFASAASLPLERVTQAFNLGFTGYYLPMTQTPDGLAQMIRENDVRLQNSAVLLVNGELAGVGLVGVRAERGWLAGMGVAPQWRGQGVGARLLGHLLDQMIAIGVRRAQLEVLEMNAPARTLYERMGFRTLRQLAVYHGPLRLSASPPPRDAATRVRATTPRLALSGFDEYHTVAPAWQRDRATLEHVRGSLDGLGLWDDGKLRAYLLFSRQSGGFAILDAGSDASSATARRDDLVRLLRTLAEPAPESAFRTINTPPGDALGDALDLLGCPVAVRQDEMIRALP